MRVATLHIAPPHAVEHRTGRFCALPSVKTEGVPKLIMRQAQSEAVVITTVIQELDKVAEEAGKSTSNVAGLTEIAIIAMFMVTKKLTVGENNMMRDMKVKRPCAHLAHLQARPPARAHPPPAAHPPSE